MSTTEIDNTRRQAAAVPLSATSTPRRRFASKAIALGSMAMMAVALTGCTESAATEDIDAEYTRICVNQDFERIADEDCPPEEEVLANQEEMAALANSEDSDKDSGQQSQQSSGSSIMPMFLWLPLYSNAAVNVPRVGSHVDPVYGTTTPPKDNAKVRVGAPASGASYASSNSNRTYSGTPIGGKPGSHPKSSPGGKSYGGFGARGGGSGS